MQNALRSSLVILLCGLFLSACGFQLAGTSGLSDDAKLPPQLESIHLVTRNLNAVQRKALERRLTDAGAQVLAEADGVSPKLAVTLNETPDQQLLAGGSGGDVVKRITRSINFNVKSADGAEMLAPRKLSRQVDLTLDDNSLLASNRERKDVTRELEDALYDQLVRLLVQI